ncbi:hypothetical protein [Streptomyces sp. NPDC059943]|uniref:hypothetical protein n=1 Tax=Streptomyces sp. NPDC059943 TaxID=3347010 RepID=UPI00365ADC1D
MVASVAGDGGVVEAQQRRQRSHRALLGGRPQRQGESGGAVLSVQRSAVPMAAQYGAPPPSRSASLPSVPVANSRTVSRRWKQSVAV